MTYKKESPEAVTPSNQSKEISHYIYLQKTQQFCWELFNMLCLLKMVHIQNILIQKVKILLYH